MLWTSLSDGLGMLTHWQTYVAVALHWALAFGPLVAISLITAKTGRAVWPLLYAALRPFFVAFAMFVIMFSLWPLYLRFTENAIWALPWQLLVEQPWVTFKILFFCVVVATLLPLVPIVGQLLSTTAVGAIMMKYVLGVIATNADARFMEKVDIWPSGWFVLGLALLAAVCAGVGALCGVFLMTTLKNNFESLDDTSAGLLATPIGTMFSLVPVFTYAAWLSYQLPH
ncbi:hypothetical protein [Roseateles sp.]|uniref:hypothetical protein n=1 Tax=Roseateles sp. TaxID=1971397 RepID=UPI003BA8EE32